MKLTSEEQTFIETYPALQEIINRASQYTQNHIYTSAIEAFSSALLILNTIKTSFVRKKDFALIGKLQLEIADCQARQAHPDLTKDYQSQVTLLQQAISQIQQAIKTLSKENSDKLGLPYTLDQLNTRLSREYFNESISVMTTQDDKTLAWATSIHLLKLSYKQTSTISKKEKHAFATQFENHADFLFLDLNNIDGDKLDINTVVELYDQADAIYLDYYRDGLSSRYLNKHYEILASKLHFYECTLSEQTDHSEREITKLASQLESAAVTTKEHETAYAYLFSQATRQKNSAESLNYARQLVKLCNRLPKGKDATYPSELEKAKKLLKQHTSKISPTVEKPAISIFQSGMSPKKYWKMLYENEQQNDTKENRPFKKTKM